MNNKSDNDNKVKVSRTKVALTDATCPKKSKLIDEIIKELEKRDGKRNCDTSMSWLSDENEDGYKAT